MDCSLCPWDFSGKNTAVGCHFLLQGMFPTQGSNQGLLHRRQTLYYLSPRGSPKQNWCPLCERGQPWSPRSGPSSSWGGTRPGAGFWVGTASHMAHLWGLQWDRSQGLPGTAWSLAVCGFPGGSEVEESARNAGDPGSIPGLGRSPGEGNGNPLQYYLENPTEEGAW